MKVNVALELSEFDLRKVRAGIGRSGLATRKETRIFVDRVLREAIGKLPEPKIRRKRDPEESTAVVPEPEPSTVCTHCGKARSEHSLYGTCPLSRSYGKGTKFKAVTA